MSDIISDLNSKQATIQEMLSKEARRKGQLDQVQASLKKEFGVDTLVAAQKKMEEIAAAITEDEKKLVALDTEMAAIITKAKGVKDVGTV